MKTTIVQGVLPTCALVIALFMMSFATVSAETWYVTPLTQCVKNSTNESCLTLSQVAANTERYFTDKTTLILLPGDHVLDTELVVKNITNLEVLASLSNSTVIVCNESNSLALHSITYLHIMDIDFHHCVNIQITNIEQFTLDSCDLNGEGASTPPGTPVIYSGLFLKSVFTATVRESSFSLFKVVDSSFDGGVLSAFHCNKVTISNSLFKHNEFPAVYVKDTNITVHGVVFHNNACRGTSVSNGAAINIDDIARDSIINLSVMNCSFMNNTAQYGGAIYIYGIFAKLSNVAIMIQGSRFESNKADYFGGAMYMARCNLTVENSLFADNIVVASFEGGALFLLYGRINIISSVFENNDVTGRYGNGGAISLYKGSNHTISQCVFKGNTADRGASINVEDSESVNVQNSSFIGNAAREYGIIFLQNCHSFTSDTFLNVLSNKGQVLYAFNSNILISGDSTLSNNCGVFFVVSTSITFQGNTNFLYNGEQFCANQTIERAFEWITAVAIHSSVVFQDKVSLVGNTAELGGAILAVESEVQMIGDITISNNYAQISGGGIYAYHSDLVFMGTSTVSITDNTAGNEGGGIHATSSTVSLLEGVLNITRNHATRGGGMFLESYAKLYIINFKRCFYTCERNGLQSINFTNNSAATYGGAIYVNDTTNSGACDSSTEFGAECFFQSFKYVNRYKSRIFFKNNIAKISGDTLYGGLLDRCIQSPYSEVPRISIYHPIPTDASSKTTNWYVSNYTVNGIQSFEPTIASDPVRVCFCNGDQPDCSYQPDTVRVRKGERFVLPVVAVDQIGRPTPSRIHSSLQSQGGTFSEKQLLQTTSETCTELEYNIFSPHDSEQLLLYAEGPCKDIGISQTSINVTFLPCDCPIGFERSNVTQTNCSCDCHSTLKPFITNCFFETKSVLRQGDFWITYEPTFSNSSSEGYVIHPNCPYDYCYPSSKYVFMNLNDSDGSDAQCAFNHSGVLCGSCQEGLSLSLGSSRCMPCSNHWLALLIPFAITGIVLVAFLLVLNLTVAIGTMNGMIFYANVIAANSAVFFPFENSHFLTIIISWLNLDFGLETCFYDGMDGYAKVWLQLAFPLYVITLVAMVIIFGDWIIIRKQCSKLFTKYSPKINPVATLATLILLSYAKLLRTIIAALSFTTIEYPDGTHKKVWLYDANLSYAEGKHIPLIIAATLILLVGLVYTILLFFWQWLLKFPSDSILKWITEHSTVADTAHTRIRNTRLYTLYNRMYSSLYSFMDTYHAPYNFKHRYWTGLLLLVRVLLYIVASFKHIIGHPNVNLLVIIIVTGALLFLCQSVYKQWPLNILLASFLFNLLTFSAGTLYLRETNGNQAALAYTSVTIAYITLLGILIYHIVKFMLNKCIQLLSVNVKNHCHTRREPVSVEQKGHCLNIIQNHSVNENTNERIVPMTEFDGLPRKKSININSNETIETEP